MQSINFNKKILKTTDMPVIKVPLYGKKYNFLLDTGANECLIDIDVVKELGDYIKIEDSTDKIEGIDSSIDIKKVMLNIKIGNCNNEILFSVLSLDNLNSFFSNDNIIISGVIGSKFFLNFNWILDFDTLKIHYPITH